VIRLQARISHRESAELGEGPIWHGDALFWVDILRGRVLRSTSDGTEEVRVFGQPVSAVFPLLNSGYALLVNTHIEFVDSSFITVGHLKVLAETGDLRLSDGAVGAGGELWFGSIRHDLEPGGTLYRLRSGETEPTAVQSGLGMPNGIAFAPGYTHLYLVDSTARTLTAFEYDIESHEISNQRVLATIEADRGTPDGIAVDTLGGIWVAHWAGGSVRRLELDGSWSQEILVPAQNVTSCVFGGPNLQTLFITTARVELKNGELSTQPAAGSVFSITLPIGGMTPPEAQL
jgi:sugar lactone lactonase YvrE